MKYLLFAVTVSGLAAMGCGSVVVEPNDTSTTIGDGGSGTTGTTGTTTSTTGTTTTGTTTTGTTTSLPSCENDPSLFMDFDLGGVPAHAAPPACSLVGYIQHSGGTPPPPPGPPQPTGSLIVDGCPEQIGSLHVHLSAKASQWPGSADSATVQLEGPTFLFTSVAEPGLVDITAMGPVGGFIEGSFNAEVVGMVGLPLTQAKGTFRVCRREDSYPP